MLNFEIVGIEIRLDACRRRSFRLRVWLAARHPERSRRVSKQTVAASSRTLNLWSFIELTLCKLPGDRQSGRAEFSATYGHQTCK